MAYILTERGGGMMYGGPRWGPGVRHTAEEMSKKVSSGAWIHYYESPYLAGLLNSMSAYFNGPILWEFEPEGETATDGISSWCKAGTTFNQVRLPYFSAEKTVVFAILSVKAVHMDAAWTAWAKGWLSGRDRSTAAARVVADNEATWDGEFRAFWAASAAARAAAEMAAAWADETRAAERAQAARRRLRSARTASAAARQDWVVEEAETGRKVATEKRADAWRVLEEALAAARAFRTERDMDFTALAQQAYRCRTRPLPVGKRKAQRPSHA